MDSGCPVGTFLTFWVADVPSGSLFPPFSGTCLDLPAPPLGETLTPLRLYTGSMPPPPPPLAPFVSPNFIKVPIPTPSVQS